MEHNFGRLPELLLFGVLAAGANLVGGLVLIKAGDHRLAMAFAIAATRAASSTTISGASSVDVSYPGFFDELARLTR